MSTVSASRAPKLAGRRPRPGPTIVHLLRVRYPHWGRRSGINQFVRYLDPRRVELRVEQIPFHTRRWLMRASNRCACFLAGGRSVRWYSMYDLVEEVFQTGRWLRERFDVVHYLDGDHSPGFLPHLLACVNHGRRRPAVLATFHQPPAQLAGIVTREAVRHLDHVTVVAPEQALFFRKFLPADRITFIPHGIDTDYFHPEPSLKKAGRLRCLTVGNWLRDYDAVYEVARRLAASTDIEFHLVPARALPPAPSAHVHIHSRLDDVELLRLYQRCDVLFLPLLDATANNALLEGMACGLPMVTSDLPGVRAYAPAAEAIRVAGNKPEAFQQALLHLQRDSQAREAMARDARQRALTFAWQRVTPQYEELYGALKHDVSRR